MRRIVSTHVEFDEDSVGSPARIRTALWNQSVPQEIALFDLRGVDGLQLDKEDVGNVKRIEYEVSSAALQFADGRGANTAFTIVTEPPNVL